MQPNGKELVPSGQQAVVGWSGDSQVAALYMPVMQITQVAQRYNAMVAFAQQVMQDGKDFGKIPGVDKPSLLKPGAEKLCTLFGLSPSFEVVTEREEWTGEEPFFYYRYRCRLSRGGVVMGEGEGSCNSRESKYRYRWVPEDQVPEFLDKNRIVSKDGTRKYVEFDFAVNKAETTGQYGKPQEYWDAFKAAIANGTARQVEKETRAGKKPAWEIVTGTRLYRIPNPDIADQVNTIQKMAQKRSLVAATLIACNASDYFTQDVEDMEFVTGGAVIDIPVIPTQEDRERVDQKVKTAEAELAQRKAVDAAKTSGKAPTESAPAPIVDEESVADGTSEMFRRMTSKKGIEQELERLKKMAIEVMGPAGESAWKQVLRKYGTETPGAFKTNELARRCAKEMLDSIESLRKLNEPDPDGSGPQPAASLLESIPDDAE